MNYNGFSKTRNYRMMNHPVDVGHAEPRQFMQN